MNEARMLALRYRAQGKGWAPKTVLLPPEAVEAGDRACEALGWRWSQFLRNVTTTWLEKNGYYQEPEAPETPAEEHVPLTEEQELAEIRKVAAARVRAFLKEEGE